MMQAGGPKVVEKLEVSILNEAQIVFSTLSGAGLKSLTLLDRGFDTLIVDEV
jgi:hypothetical protein